jgi:hypothetical protein
MVPRLTRLRCSMIAAGLATGVLVGCAPDGPDFRVRPPPPERVDASVSDGSEAIGLDGDSVQQDPATTVTSRVDGSPAVRLAPVTELGIELSFIVARPGIDGLYAVGKSGRIELLHDLPTSQSYTDHVDRGELSPVTVLDITEITLEGIEEGLLGLAFHPDANLAYVHHSNIDGVSTIAEYEVAGDGSFIDSTRRVVFEVAQSSSNHNGGGLAFGPDGFLYIGLGDGSEYSDLQRTALELKSPLGKILRIDPVVGPSGPYSVPADNPFVGLELADHRIWAYGLRNPFSFSFDEATGDLWLADVGQAEFEEVNHSEAENGRDAGRGVSYGWSAVEGDQPFNPDQLAPDAEEPLIVYSHADGRCAVIGGHVVRDAKVADLDGWYIFGDWCSNEVWMYREGIGSVAAGWLGIGEVERFVGVARSNDGDVYAIGSGGALSLVVPSR